jgi:hypothetical protein
MKGVSKMTTNVFTGSHRTWINPIWIVAPASIIIFAMGWSNFGFAAGLIGGVGGLVWVLALAGIVRLIQRSEKLAASLSTIVAVAAGATLFLTMGGGIYEYMLMRKALATTPEWIVTITAGPLGEQVILYFIIFNSLLEIFLVPLALLLNWHMPGRRVFVLAAGLIFYVIRIWTYLYFAPQYFEFGEMAFSEQLVNNLVTRMSIDNIRFVIQTIEAGLFFRAALGPVSSVSNESKS